MSLFWEQLLDLIEERAVIPVIGPELLTVAHDSRADHLYPLLAHRLGESLEVPTEDLPEGSELNAVACRFIAQQQDVQDLYPILKKAMPGEEELEIPEPLLQLAQIRNFNLFVTTTFDPLLVRALDQVRFGGKQKTIVRCFSPNGGVEDIPDRPEDLETPVVYHLFGKLSAMPSYAVTHEDLLEFVHALQAPETKSPELLFDALKSSNLIIVGPGLSDWLVRLFLRIAKRQRLLQVRASTDYLADAQVNDECKLAAFLKHYSKRTRVYTKGGGVDFVDELHRLWLERHPDSNGDGPVVGGTASRDLIEPGAVFLSYASEDREAAKTLKEALERVGIDVFFDREQLRAGDDWEQKLERGISECSLFVPLISNSSLVESRRYFRAEWDSALKEARMVASNDRFLLPVVVDETSQDEPSLPARFRSVQWVKAPGGQPSPDFVVEVRDLYRRYRAREVGR